MRRALEALVLAVAIPAFALWLIITANEKLNADLIANIIRDIGPQPPDVMARLRLPVLCARPDVAPLIPEACGLSSAASVLAPAAIAAIVLSLATLGALVPLRTFARRDRRILALFRPALLLLLAALTVIVVLDGAAVAGALYLGEQIYAGSIHPFIVFGIGVAVFVAATGVLRAALTMGRLRPIDVDGLLLEPTRDGRIYAMVGDVAKQIGASPPDQILAGLDPTFFVTEGPVKAFDGTYRGRTLFLSVPFIRLLSRRELVGVIGHELGHFRGEDTIFSRRFYPVYRGSIESLGVLRASSRGWAGIPLLPPLRILELFFLSFAGAERTMSRQRELLADTAGAEAASANDLAVALIKLEAFAGAWGSAYAEAVRAVRDGQSPSNLSVRFHELAVLGARPSHLSDVDHGRIRHPTDSHPPTSERLRALGVDAQAEVGRAIDLDPADPAFALIDDGEALEADLMEDLQTKLGESDTRDAADDAGDRAAAIRAAASQDAAVADLLALVETVRGRTLQPPIRPAEPWELLADLEVLPHPEPTAFVPFVASDALPSGDQQLVVGIASKRTSIPARIRAGTRARLVGASLQAARQAGRTEMMFDLGGRLLTIRTVGDWPIEHQIGGLLVAPVSDPLVGQDSRLREKLTIVIQGLFARADGVERSGPPSRDA